MREREGPPRQLPSQDFAERSEQPREPRVREEGEQREVQANASPADFQHLRRQGEREVEAVLPQEAEQGCRNREYSVRAPSATPSSIING